VAGGWAGGPAGGSRPGSPVARKARVEFAVPAAELPPEMALGEAPPEVRDPVLGGGVVGSRYELVAPWWDQASETFSEDSWAAARKETRRQRVQAAREGRLPPPEPALGPGGGGEGGGERGGEGGEEGSRPASAAALAAPAAGAPLKQLLRRRGVAPRTARLVEELASRVAAGGGRPPAGGGGAATPEGDADPAGGVRPPSASLGGASSQADVDAEADV